MFATPLVALSVAALWALHFYDGPESLDKDTSMDVTSTPTDTINPGELIRWRIGKEEFVGYMGSRGPNLSNCITATGESFPVVNADISRR